MAINSSILAWKISWTEKPGHGVAELDMTEHMHARIRATNSGPHIRFSGAQELLTTVLFAQEPGENLRVTE